MKKRRPSLTVVDLRPQTKLDIVIWIGAITDMVELGQVKPAVAINTIRDAVCAFMDRWIVRDRKRRPESPIRRRGRGRRKEPPP